MDEIKIGKKDDSVSFEQIHELLYAAHAENRKKGFRVKTAELSAEQLAERLNPDGVCFVAKVHGELAGVSAVRFTKSNRWYAGSRIADQVYVAILPDFRGLHLSTALHREIVKTAKERGVGQLELRTAANNTAMQRACMKWGFQPVDFCAFHGLDHYTVVLCKWLDGKAPPTIVCRIQYSLRKLKTIFLYKPGRVRRF